MSAPVPVPVPTQAPDTATAASLAFRYGKPVEVLGERTDSSQTFAQPDGTLRSRRFATPQWVQQGTGWVPVATKLSVVGGSVVPAATTLDMRFSAGGTAPLVTVAKGARTLSLTWLDPKNSTVPKILPAPKLIDNTAVYADVLDGVDLKVTANADSFSEVLIVKSATAPGKADLAQLRFRVAAVGVSVNQGADGTIKVVDASGHRMFYSDGASMWPTPAAVAPAASVASLRARALSSTDAGAEPVIDPQVIPVSLSQDSLTVTPSQTLLKDPNTVFPVYIDPGFNGGKEIWTEG